MAQDPDASRREARLRTEFRAWLGTVLPEGWVAAADGGDVDELRRLRRSWDWFAFLDRLGEAGYAAPSWPKEHGGLDAGPGGGRLMAEELAAMRLPVVSPNIIGIGMAGPTLIEHGTDQQRRRYLPPILRCREIWCQLFSEPDAGSDLAGLATKADRRGDHYLVTGQKVWTSLAHVARFGMLLARTDPDVPKHAGITWFILDMESEGVHVRPLRQMSGDAEFNEVFLQGVRVPAENVVGGEGNGWTVAKTTLFHERMALAGPTSGRYRLHRDLLTADVPESRRQEVLRRYVEGEVGDATRARVAAQRRRGQVPGPEGSIGKIAGAELNQRITTTALDILGPSAMLDDQRQADIAEALYRFLRARANTIEGGTSEVLRNLLGERVLGLPGEPRVDLGRNWRRPPV